MVTMAVAGLAMLAFAQNQPGTKGETAALSTGSTLGVNGAGKAAIQTKPMLDVRDVSGVDCTGATDSASALNALTGRFPTTDNAITGRTLSFGGCPSIKLSRTWLIKNQAAFIIDGFTRSGAAGKGVHIIWVGSASGVMIDMEYVDGFQVQGLFVDGSTRGGVGIVVDKNGSGGTWNTTDGRLISNTFQGAAPNWVGVSISPVSVQNVEDMRVEDSAFYCAAPVSTTSAVGVMIGASANAKNEIVKHINVSRCLYAVWQKNGSMQVLDSEFTSNGGTCASGTGADIRIDTTTDVDIISGNLDENSTQGINVNNDSSSSGPGHPVLVTGNHAAPAGCENTSRYWYNTPTGGPWIFDGDSWDADSGLVKVIGTNNIAPLGQQIYTRGLKFPNATFNPWWLNASTAIADDLKIMDDKLMVYGAVTGRVPGSGNSYPSPYLAFRGYNNGSTSNPDDFALQNIPASGTGTSGGTFLIKHQRGATGTEMFGWDGSYPGINIATIPTPSVQAVTPQGTTGSTIYSYAVVAYGPLGNTTGSAKSNTRTGNTTLTSTNFNLITWFPVAGATKYCVWRTASAGTPSSTGNIGCTSALQAKAQQVPQVFGYSVNISSVMNPYRFNDTGLAGDSSGLPSSNTTGTLSLPGQITSTLATGSAPLSITSTTPVSNLTLKNHPQVYEAGVLTTSEKIYTNTQTLVGGAATHTFSDSFTFTGSRTFGCTCTDQTAANACRAVPASATAVTLAGTGADVLWLECAGH